MKKYRVEVPFLAYVVLHVEAENEDDACERVEPDVDETPHGGLMARGGARLTVGWPDCAMWDEAVASEDEE